MSSSINAALNGPERYTVPMSVKEIAALFKIHRNSAARWLNDGQIKGKRIGSKWRILESELPCDPPSPA